VSGLIAVGTVLRLAPLVTDDATVFLVSCHVCAILNGVSGVTIQSAPALISSLWFPVSERTTATSINQAANALGNGLAMVLGPAMVRDNWTSYNNSTVTRYFLDTGAEVGGHFKNESLVDQTKHEIHSYMQMHAGVAVFLFGVIIIYFPSKPSLPPAPTSSLQRTDFRAGFHAFITNRDALLTTFSYSISQGIMGSWMGVMVLNLKALDISETQIGLLGLASVIGQCSMAMLVGFFTDRLRGHMKMTLILLLIVATGFFVWLMLMCLKILPHTVPLLYVTVITSTSINFACAPLFFELTVEIAYPVNESLVGGFLAGVTNFVGIVFLFIFFIPNIGSVWMNYVLVGSTAVVLPTVLAIKERYNRSQVDQLVADNA